MSKPTVVDACALVLCYQDFLVEEETSFAMFLTRVFERGHISIDDEGHAIQEYDDTAKPGAVREGLKTWIAEQARIGKVIEYRMDKKEKKRFRLLGLPQKDYKWIGIALGSRSSVIVTDDIDLFDPGEKKSNGERRKKLMEARGGKIAICCRKTFNIHICTCSGYDDVLSIVDEP